LNQHHPAAETPSWLLVSGRKLGGENTTQFLELAGKVVSASRRVGFLVMDPGGADQGRIPEGSTQVEIGALRCQPQPKGGSFPPQLPVPGLQLLSTGLRHGAVSEEPLGLDTNTLLFALQKTAPGRHSMSLAGSG
jgi:hypothetical protein